MKIYDITRTLQDAPVYSGDPAPVIEELESPGAGARCSRITAGSHSGTHADAFSRFLVDGLTVDKMPLELYCGPCRVLTVPAEELVKQEDLQGRLGGAERLVLRSGGKAFLCEEAAEYIAGCGVRALVTDAVSVGPADNEVAVHHILMESGVAIIENAVLDGVPDGDYLLFAFPAKYGGCDGAPVRAVLLCEGEEETNAAGPENAGEASAAEEKFLRAAPAALDNPGPAD